MKLTSRMRTSVVAFALFLGSAHVFETLNSDLVFAGTVPSSTCGAEGSVSEPGTTTSTFDDVTMGAYFGDPTPPAGQTPPTATPAHCPDGFCLICLFPGECNRQGFCRTNVRDGINVNCRIAIPEASCRLLGITPVRSPRAPQEYACSKMLKEKDLKKFLEGYPQIPIPEDQREIIDTYTNICTAVEEYTHGKDHLTFPPTERRCQSEQRGDEAAIACYRNFYNSLCAATPPGTLPSSQRAQLCARLANALKFKELSLAMQQCTCKMPAPPTDSAHCASCKQKCVDACEAYNRGIQPIRCQGPGGEGTLRPGGIDCEASCKGLTDGYCLGEYPPSRTNPTPLPSPPPKPAPAPSPGTPRR